MYRYINVGFGAFIIILSAFSVVSPEGTLTVLMSPDYTISVIRIILASLLIAYSAFPALRFNVFHKGLLAYVAAFAWFVAFSLMSDTAKFPAPMDLFFGTQGSILSLIAYFDFSRPKYVQRHLPQFAWFDLLLTRFRSLRAPAPTYRAQRKHA